MKYTIKQFAEDLKEKATRGLDQEKIGEWAWSVYDYYLGELDDNFERILKRLDLMQEGYQFQKSHKMLIKIADDILAGKTVDINSEEYKESD